MTDSPSVLVSNQSIWIGYDSREAAAFAVAKYSIRRFDRYTPIRGVVLDQLQLAGLYTRPTREQFDSEGHRRLIDLVSIRDDYDGSISTEHANARFLVPFLAKTGWALFLDSDVMVKKNLTNLFSLARPDKAVMCVKHDYVPTEGVKMDGQSQVAYERKNWSSVVLWNCDHPANKRLTVEMVNGLPGRDLHRFCWLADDEIGELPPEWNYLVGISDLNGKSPAIVHFTKGLPDMQGYEYQEYADEWKAMRPYAVGAL